jgi:hypothetical protein
MHILFTVWKRKALITPPKRLIETMKAIEADDCFFIFCFLFFGNTHEQ